MEKIIGAVLICLLMGYFVGGINPSYIISLIKGFDIRKKDSGNPGASNAMIVLGKTVGIFCAIFDILKAYFVVKISSKLFPFIKLAGMIAGVACIIGHMFPVFMKFNGGKGLACIGGVLLSYDYKLFIILLTLEVIIAFITTYICFVATTGSVIFTVILYIQNGLIYASLFIPVIIAVWYKHLINFRRIRYGVEAKFEYLWNKDKEEERVRNNWNRLCEKEREYVNLLEFNI